MIALLLGSFFSRWALGTLLLLLATLVLPAKPVLWTGFCASPLFKTWRAYFSYSYLAVSTKKKDLGRFWGCATGRSFLLPAALRLSPPPRPLLSLVRTAPPAKKNQQEEILSSRDEKDPSKPKSYIFVEFPHGAIPLSELISGTVCQVRIFVLFLVPYFRRFFVRGGAHNTPPSNSPPTVHLALLPHLLPRR